MGRAPHGRVCQVFKKKQKYSLDMLTHPLTCDYNMSMSTEIDTRTLTALDRCDSGKCGAAAKVLVKGLEGELLFCGHHYNKHETALDSWAYETVDERHLLPPKTTHTS